MYFGHSRSSRDILSILFSPSTWWLVGHGYIMGFVTQVRQTPCENPGFSLNCDFVFVAAAFLYVYVRYGTCAPYLWRICD